ncbi:MAG: oligosaccharide flippase family protein, partial [Desulfobacula sp.]|nr:oligosaccharide flippase family protein [Desulfobacula sp.]
MRELKKSFWDILTISGATFLSVPLMILSESIQARYLGPANYGKVALILSAISLLYLFGLSWLRVSFIRFGKEEFVKENSLRKTTANFFVNNIFSFIIISISFYIFRKSIFNFLEIKNSYAFWIILFGCLLGFLKNFVFEVLKVIRLIKLQTILLRLVTKIFILFGMLLFVFNILEINVNYIILIFLVSDLLIIIIGFCFIKFDYFFPLSFDKKMIKRMLIFSYPLFFSAWSSYIINWVDAYVIKYFMNLEYVGIYQAAYKIFGTFKSFWGAGLVTITLPIIMVFKTNGQSDKIKNVYLKRLIPQVSFLGMILISFIIVSTDFAFNLIYGTKFNDSIIPFKILVASQNFTIVSSMLTAIIISYDMTKMLSILGISLGIFNIIADIILVQYFGIIGAAISSFLVFSIAPVIWLFYIN